MQATAKRQPPIVEIRQLTQIIQQRAEAALPPILAGIKAWDGEGHLHIPVNGQSDEVMAVLQQRIRQIYPRQKIYVFRPNP